MRTLLIGTGNSEKAAEMRTLLSGLDIELIDLSRFPHIDTPVETGHSFSENAEIKARAYSRATRCYTLADDSGLEVVALGYGPGIFSARFAGKGATDKENIAKLLDEIALTGIAERTARFVCAICLTDPNGRTIFSDAANCDGEISVKPRGINGFGYDPIFIPHGWKQTFGELPSHVKRSISHRSLAAEKLAEFLASNLDLLT